MNKEKIDNGININIAYATVLAFVFCWLLVMGLLCIIILPNYNGNIFEHIEPKIINFNHNYNPI